MPLEVQVEDLAVPMEDQEIKEEVAEDLEIAQQVVVRAKIDEATESIDILKDRKFQ